jgi:hypothetical protein
METGENPDTCEQQYMSTEQLTSEVDNINQNVKSEEPIAAVVVKERIQQNLLQIMNSVQFSNDLTALKQLYKSLIAAENLFISLNQSKSLTHLETVTNAPANRKIDGQKNSILLQKKGSENKKLDMPNQHKTKNKSYLMFTILIHIRLCWQRQIVKV